MKRFVFSWGAEGAPQSASGKCVLIRAEDVREGDRVLFRASFANYTVEDVTTTSIGQVAHIHGDGMAQSAYWPDELLWVEGRA